MTVSARGPGARLAVVVGAAVLLAGCSHASPAAKPGAEGRPASSPVISRSVPALPSPRASASPAGSASPAARPVAPGAGDRPQTRAFPSPDSAAFGDAMHDVWLAVTSGDAELALPAFFPRAAYQKLKAIDDPGADWDGRLWHDFSLDVGAAHRVVGPGAQLTRVIVASGDAAWIDPGVCANSIGYWHVAGARLVYRQDGQERSIGIASLISWRGVWYVVHFGAVLRSTATGIVDDAEPGPGTAGPPGGC